MQREDVLLAARGCGFDPHDMSDDFTVNLENIERFAVAMYLAGAEDSGAWKRWVLDHLVVCHILSAEHENNPEKAIDDLISWHVWVALDPLVSSGAQALVAKGAEDMRERAKDVLKDRQAGAEAAFESHKTDYWEGRMDEADFCLQAIRALPVTPTNTEGEQG